MKKYDFKSLAVAYNPHIAPQSASKRLRAWIDHVPTLRARLERAGWRRGAHTLTPRMVAMIEQELGAAE